MTAKLQSKVTRPLEGIRVVDLGVWHAGPGAAAILGDLGAEVIKIETPAGDPERFHGNFAALADIPLPAAPDDWTILFEISNRNKRGITLDLTEREDKAVFDRLVDSADIFVTNLRLSTREKLGVDYASLSAERARLVYLTVSAFGPEGPMAATGGFDGMGQAVSGMAFLGGTAEPSIFSIIVLDQLTAITASHAAITALAARELHGIGQEVHTSLYGAATWLQHGTLQATALAGQEIDTSWDRRNASPLRTTFRCGDGAWIMGTNHPPARYWSAFCTTLGRPDLIEDPRFSTDEGRKTNRLALFDELDAAFAAHTASDWLAALGDAGLLFAPVNTLSDVLADEQARVNGYVVEVDHRMLGSIQVPGYPIHFSKQPLAKPGPAPTLGEHTTEIVHALAEGRFSER